MNLLPSCLVLGRAWPVPISRSRPQVHLFLLKMFYVYKVPPPKVLSYDDGCHLKKFLENRAVKDGARFAAWVLESMAIVVDKCAAPRAPTLLTPSSLASRPSRTRLRPPLLHPVQVPLAESQEQPLLRGERQPRQVRGADRRHEHRGRRGGARAPRAHNAHSHARTRALAPAHHHTTVRSPCPERQHARLLAPVAELRVAGALQAPLQAHERGALQLHHAPHDGVAQQAPRRAGHPLPRPRVGLSAQRHARTRALPLLSVFLLCVCCLFCVCSLLWASWVVGHDGTWNNSPLYFPIFFA